MLPTGIKRTLAPGINRLIGSLSQQFKRFAISGRGQALAVQAASSPSGAVFKKMPVFSQILQEAQQSAVQPTWTGVSAPRKLEAASPTEPMRRGAFASSVRERWVEHTVRPGETLWGLAVKKFHVNPQELAAQNNIEDPRRLQVGQRLRVKLPSYSGEQSVVASWYGHEHHGKPMANGEPFNMHAATIAHKDLPLGTKVEIRNPENGQRVVAVVTDRGPYVRGRDVDLSYGLAKRLNLVEKGVGKVIMRVLG
ncbi:MAG: septal ring lytic transglycosylase RlpA family protein [Thermodesulfobacteriota bacterium]